MVIAIIGILVTTGLVSLRGVRASARDAVRNHDLAQLRLGLALYFDDNGSYPYPVKAGGAGPDFSTELVDGTIFSQNGNPLYPGYLSRPFTDPVNQQGLGYYYYYDTNDDPAVNHRNYVLCFHEESDNSLWFYFYSTGVYGEGDHCPTLPAT